MSRENISLFLSLMILFSALGRMFQLQTEYLQFHRISEFIPAQELKMTVPISKTSVKSIDHAWFSKYFPGQFISTGVYVTTDGGVTWYGSDTLDNGSFSFRRSGTNDSRRSISNVVHNLDRFNQWLFIQITE